MQIKKFGGEKKGGSFIFLTDDFYIIMILERIIHVLTFCIGNSPGESS